jgi:hypothetical protein
MTHKYFKKGFDFDRAGKYLLYRRNNNGELSN